MRTLLRSFFVVLACAVVGLLAAAGPALATGHGSKALVVRPRFQPLGADLTPATNGRDVAILGLDNALTLIDQGTGSSTSITLPPCSQPIPGVGFAGPWLDAICENSDGSYVVDLYSLKTREWRTIPGPCVTQDYGEAGGTQCDIGPLGADWLSWTSLCWDCGSASGLMYLGRGLQPWFSLPPTSSTTVLDYNSPNLTARLCAPLRNARRNHLLVDPAGAFTADGGYDTPLGKFAVAGTTATAPVLERCGSHLHYQLPAYPMAGNANELIFYQYPSRTLTGLFLPSLRRFEIHLPSEIAASKSPATGQSALGALLLSSRTLYVVAPDFELWDAPAPQPPLN